MNEKIIVDDKYSFELTCTPKTHAEKCQQSTKSRAEKCMILFESRAEKCIFAAESRAEKCQCYGENGI